MESRGVWTVRLVVKRIEETDGNLANRLVLLRIRGYEYNRFKCVVS